MYRIGRSLMALALVLSLVASIGFSTAPLSAETPAALKSVAPKIDSALRERLQADGRAPALIVLSNQLDTSFAEALPTKLAKGRAVFDALTAQARRDQPAVLAFLASRGIKGRGFLTLNAIGATLDQATADLLAARPDIARIDADLPTIHVEPIIVSPPSLRAPETTEWGVNAVKAPQVWALGFRGQGIVIAGEDTGVRWTHNALKSHYRGWNGTTADHNYNWHDAITAPAGGNPCGAAASPFPCDDNNHGSHTVGTVVGDDGAGNQIGVAPGAKWIACRNMDAGNGTPTTYIDCIDWMLAPYPIGGTSAQGDPSKAPDIVTNSWGCPPEEGCVNTDADGIQPSIRAVVNAGIFFNASAGNSGSACATVLSPPALYPESFSVAAYGESGAIAGFSSRGPITYNGVTRIGPNIAAPGVNVRSSFSSSDTAYSAISGTSMASPHVAGVVALLWSARPELIGHVDLTRLILQETAVATTSTQTCGGTPGSSIPNNTFGYGKVDALAAIGTTLKGSIRVNGTAATSATLAIAPVNVQLVRTSGAYSTTLPSGTYTLTATVPGFAPQSAVVTITEGAVTTHDFSFGADGVSIVDFGFQPANLTIQIGDSVRWTNNGAATHTSTSDTSLWDSGNLSSTQSFTHTFNTAGLFPYHCAIHASMTATITVIDPNAGSLSGDVTVDGAPAAGATITINPGGHTPAVDGAGAYAASLPAGTYTVTAALSGFAPQSAQVTITAGGSVTRDFAFTTPTGTLTGMITLDGAPRSDGTVLIQPGNINATVSATGAYTASLPAGTYTVTASLTGFNPITAQVTVTAGGSVTQDFAFTTSVADVKNYFPLLVK